MKNIPTPAILMGTLALICLVVLFTGLRRVLYKQGPSGARMFRNTLLITIAWLTLISLLALKGFFSKLDTLPPRPVFLMLLPLPVVLWIAFSKKFRQLAQQIPLHWLIGFQSFRILVELLLWQSFVQGLLPVQMSFEGRNFDILAGILALPVAWWIAKKKQGYRTAGLLYNILGLALLINVLIVAVLSMPLPFRYFLEGPSVEAVGRFPMIFLPGVLVVLAYSFHIFSLRQLWLLGKLKRQHHSDAAAVPGFEPLLK